MRKHGRELVTIWMLQVYQDYHLPISPREITIDELRFFYEPLVDGIIDVQRMGK